MQAEESDLALGKGSQWVPASNDPGMNCSLVIIKEDSADEESEPGNGFQFYKQNTDMQR